MTTVVVDCTHPRVRHQHGTRVAYSRDRCRCAACCAANAAYEQQRSRLAAYGRARLVDAGPVRDHLHRLRQAGIGTRRIASMAGVSRTVLIKVLYGVHPGDPGHPDHRKPSARVSRDTAARILAVTPAVADGARVDATGTRRRLQALAAIGWTQRAMARLIRVTPSTITRLITGADTRTLAGTARRTATIYARLEHIQAPSRRAVAAAARRGWLAPAWWDPDTIDDPAWRPDTRDLRILDLDDACLLLRRGVSPVDVADTVGLPPYRLHRELRAAGHHDLAAHVSTYLQKHGASHA